MLFPLVTMGVLWLGIDFTYGCTVLMLIGSQWYILFNVIAGAQGMPGDLREIAKMYGIKGWALWRTLYLPAIFPSLVTGLITAAGGAWNASIVAEFVHFKDQTLVAPGLGSLITRATEEANFPLLCAGVMTMSFALVLINRVFWKRLYAKAASRYMLTGKS
jgi:NitT/TauT family transport system permease protein